MRTLVTIALLAIVGCSANACRANHSPPAISWNARTGTIDVTGLRNPAGAVLTVHSGPPDAPAMLGRIETRDDGLVFHPRFPLVPGLRYRVRVNETESTIVIPKSATAASTYVAQIFPSADELPANQLKFYLEFSAPMSVGDVYRHIHLHDAQGHAVQRAFLQTAHELWDDRRQRFTLILDPGRIKRGLRANLESGAPLREGAHYQLVIDAAWPDGDGNPLREPFKKSFRVTAPDRAMPDPRKWRIRTPAANTNTPLHITFDEPLDRALLEDMLLVRDDSGTSLDGASEIAGAETEWLFRPQTPWRKGTYAVHVDSRMEDRAGNNLQRLFDQDAQAPRNSAKEMTLRFTVH